MTNTPALDNEGFLQNYKDWTPAIACFLAEQENVLLNQAHWEIIELVCEFYATYDHSPSTRPLVKFVQQRLGPEKGQSIYLMKLFNGSPTKRVCKIAGLPKPANCL